MQETSSYVSFQLAALKEAIDKESEHKCELMKLISDTSDTTKKKVLNQQLDKCDEKLESLMMMMVHYCAGLQHCLDMEEAQRRLQEGALGEGVGLQMDSSGEGSGPGEGDREELGAQMRDGREKERGKYGEIDEQEENGVDGAGETGDIVIRGRVVERVGDEGRDGALQASGDSDSLEGVEDSGIQFIVTEEHF